MTKPELTTLLWLAVGYIGFSMIVMLSLAQRAFAGIAFLITTALIAAQW